MATIATVDTTIIAVVKFQWWNLKTGIWLFPPYPR